MPETRKYYERRNPCIEAYLVTWENLGEITKWVEELGEDDETLWNRSDKEGGFVFSQVGEPMREYEYEKYYLVREHRRFRVMKKALFFDLYEPSLMKRKEIKEDDIPF